MIVLDTNVISEIMKGPDRRSAAVYGWLATQDGEALYTTTVTFGEIWFGFDLLPDGKRKSEMQAKALEVFEIGFRDRMLDYDKPAARHYARIAAARARRGLHVPKIDVMIASIASVRAMAVATRNERDFADCGVTVINPWDHTP